MRNQQTFASGALPAEILINGSPATSESLLNALLDIHDDMTRNPPEHRCYIPEAWDTVIDRTRRFLALPREAAALASREASAPMPILALRVASDALEHGVVAMGSDGEWVSVRRHVRDAAVAAMRAALASPQVVPTNGD